MRLWRALEEMRGWAGVRAVWREHFGDELQFLEPLLRPLEQEAMSLYRDNRLFRIVMHDEDDIVAIDEETGDAFAVGHDEVVIYKLDADTLLRSVANVLGLIGEPSSVGMGIRLWWLGEFVPFEGDRFPVYLATTRDVNDLVTSAGHISAMSLRPFVLITPTRRGASEALDRVIQGRHAVWLTLEDLLVWEGDGVFTTKRPLKTALADFIAGHVKTNVASNDGARFPTPAGAGWPDVLIRITDGTTAHVSVKGEIREIDCASMGLASRRNRKPTRQWQLLELFAHKRGYLRRRDQEASPALQKRKETLAKQLQAYFGIDGDPIELVDETDWRCRFRVEMAG